MAEDNFSKYVLIIVGIVVVFALVVILLPKPEDTRVGAGSGIRKGETVEQATMRLCNPTHKVECNCGSGWSTSCNCGCPSKFDMRLTCTVKGCEGHLSGYDQPRCKDFCCTGTGSAGGDAQTRCDNICKNQGCTGTATLKTAGSPCSGSTQNCGTYVCECKVPPEPEPIPQPGGSSSTTTDSTGTTSSYPIG